MAIVHVTFGRTASTGGQYTPLEQGRASTETLTPESIAEQTSIEASPSENVVTIYSDADVWIAVGSPNNNALLAMLADGDPGSGRRFLPAGAQRQFACQEGDAVAAVEA